MDQKDLNAAKKELEAFEEKREQIIKDSRDILRLSKLAITALHRSETKEAQAALSQAEVARKKLQAMMGSDLKLRGLGSYSEAMQEYAEALCYAGYVTKGELPSYKKVNIDYEDFLMGVCDLTGELARRAVHKTIAEEYTEVYAIRDFVDEIHTFFLTLSLRNSELRKKYDAIKWNLKKIEDIVYDIKTKGLDHGKKRTRSSN